MRTLFTDDFLSYDLDITDATFQSKWIISPDVTDSRLYGDDGYLAKNVNSANMYFSPNYDIPNNAIVDLVVYTSYSWYRINTREGFFFYPKANAATLNRGTLSTNFPDFSNEVYGVWTQNWNFNIRWGGNFNETATNQTWTTHQSIQTEFNNSLGNMPAVIGE